MVKKLKRSKECPSCKEKVGPRTIKCQCGHVFVLKNKTIKNSKQCPNCFTNLRPRAKECNKCQFKFPIKKRHGYVEIKDWKKLKRGYVFNLRKGSRGPYYKGEKQNILMAYRGQFSVIRIEKEGIVAYSQAEGFAFIYMGNKRYCEFTGLHKRPYRLFEKIK